MKLTTLGVCEYHVAYAYVDISLGIIVRPRKRKNVKYFDILTSSHVKQHKQICHLSAENS